MTMSYIYNQKIQLVALNSAAVCIIQSTMSRRRDQYMVVSEGGTAVQIRPVYTVHTNECHINDSSCHVSPVILSQFCFTITQFLMQTDFNTQVSKICKSKIQNKN